MHIISKIGIVLTALGLIIAVVFMYFLHQPLPVFTRYLVYGGVLLSFLGMVRVNGDKKHKKTKGNGMEN